MTTTIDSAMWTGRWRPKCKTCKGTGNGKPRYSVEDRGDTLYTVYEACKPCDGTGERT